MIEDPPPVNEDEDDERRKRILAILAGMGEAMKRFWNWLFGR